MKLILKNHNGKYAVSKRKAPNSRKWCSTWENSISFAFGHFVKLLYNQSQKMPPNPNCPPIPFSRTGLIYQGMSASPWLSHPGPAKALNCEHLSQKTKYERVFFHLDVGIELNCEPRNYQRIGIDLVVENLAVAGCLGAACDCWVGIVATSNSQNWGLEGGGVPTLTLAALFPAAGSLTWTREENHLVRRRGWQDKIR